MPTPSSALRALINLILDARASHGSIVGTDHEATEPSAYGSLVYDLIAAMPQVGDLPAKVDELDDQALGEASLPLLNRVGLDLEGSKVVLSEVIDLVQQVLGATVKGIENTAKAIESAQGGGASEAAPAAPAAEAAAPEAAAAEGEAKPDAAAEPGQDVTPDAAPSAPQAEPAPIEAPTEPAQDVGPEAAATEGTGGATTPLASEPLQEASATAEAPPEGDALTPPAEGEAKPDAT